jgi:hypothetical protein
MCYQFRPCNFEMDFDAYTKFLLQHHDELNLPYSFAMKLSFISSPLIFGKAMLIFNEEPYEIAGAAAFVYGTGANRFEDKYICQIEVAFIQKAYRRTSVFVRGLETLVTTIKEGNPEVELVQFWVSPDQKELGRLLAKFGALPGSTKSRVNGLDCYKIPFHELEAFCHRFRAA